MKTSTSFLLGSLVALVLAGVSAYLFGFIPWLWPVFLGIAVLGFGYYVFLEKNELKTSLGRKTTQYGLNSALMSLLVVIAVVIVNMIVSGYDKKHDFTKNRAHTLSEQSEKVVRGLKGEVKVRAFVNPQQQGEFTKFFDKYTYISKNVKPDFVDVDKDPTAVTRYGIKTAGTLVFETPERTVKVDNIFGPEDPKIEEKFTNALIQVTKGDKKKACFTSGHGERLVSDTQRDGYSDVKDSLENGRFKVEEIVLIEKPSVPTDCELLVIAGPKSDFMDQETKMIEAYIRAGGKTMLLLDPDSSSALKGLLTKFGVDWKARSVVLETNQLQQLAGGNPLAPVVRTFDSSHEITKDLKQLSIYVNASPVEKAADVPPGNTVTSLFSTSSRSFEMSEDAIKKSGGRIALDESKNRRGPLSLAVAVTGKAADAPAKPEDSKKDPKKPDVPAGEKKDSEFRIVVVGDSDFATNAVKKFGINADVFQNMLAWLSKEEDLIAIRPKATDASEFDITENRAKVIFLTSTIFAPLLLWGLGIGIWLWRRRK